MTKTEIYSWRLAPELKDSLEARARAMGVSIAQILDRLAREWLKTSTPVDDEAEQRRLHAAVAPLIGSICGDDPDRSQNAGQLIRERLRRRHAQA